MATCTYFKDSKFLQFMDYADNCRVKGKVGEIIDLVKIKSTTIFNVVESLRDSTKAQNNFKKFFCTPALFSFSISLSFF